MVKFIYFKIDKGLISILEKLFSFFNYLCFLEGK